MRQFFLSENVLSFSLSWAAHKTHRPSPFCSPNPPPSRRPRRKRDERRAVVLCVKLLRLEGLHAHYPTDVDALRTVAPSREVRICVAYMHAWQVRACVQLCLSRSVSLCVPFSSLRYRKLVSCYCLLVVVAHFREVPLHEAEGGV